MKMLYAVLFLLIANTVKYVTTEFIGCAQTCDNTKKGNLIDFGSGKTYFYNFDAETALNVKSLDIKVGIKSRVEISTQTQCDLTLHLRNVQLIGATNYHNNLKQQLESYPIVFGYDGGNVVEVCPSEYDELWVINLKKSIISAFQVTTNSTTTKVVVIENDILGDCQTLYEPKNSFSGTILMEKTKSLNNCKYSYKTRTSNSLNELLVRNAPVIESFVICSQTINNGLLKDVTCKQQQLFLPSILTVNKPVVFSTLSLSLVQQIVGHLPKNKRINNLSKIKQDLTMNMNEKSTQMYTESDVLNLLTTLCVQLYSNNVTDQTIAIFSELISALRSISPLMMQRLSNGDEWMKNAFGCKTAKLRDLFFDASALASSEGSVNLLLNLHYNENINGLRAYYLLSLLSFSSNPNQNALKLLITLLDSDNVGRQEILAVSAFVNNLCRDNKRCDSLEQISFIVDALIKKLYSQNIINTITAIQALENIDPKYLGNATKHLADISIERNHDDGVRVAAMSVLTKLSDQSTQEALLKIFYDETESIEVRIAAYKSMVMSGKVSSFHLQKISHVNHQYLVNYVRSHIKNLKETLNPRKKGLLPDKVPVFAEPDNNYFGTSRNIEMSYFYGETNLGLSFEADIIYSHITRFPRSIKIMISFPINGKEFEAIEITVRQKILETYLQEILFKSSYNLNQIMEKIIELFQNEAIIQSPDIFAQLFVKLNGKNMLALDTKDLNSPNIKNFRQFILNFFNSLTIDRAFGIQLFDTYLLLPTITGFPLIIDLNGTLLSALETKIDSKNVLSNYLSMFNIEIMPSLVIELSAGMHLQAANSRSGIKFTTSISSSTGVKLDVKKRDEYSQEITINLPKDKQSLMKFEAKVESRDSEGRTGKIDSFTQTTIKSCTRTLHNLLGISYCSSLSLPRVDIISGILISELYLEKSDKSMDSLVVTLEWPRNPSDDTHLWQIIIDKPNSFINRQSYAKLELTKSRSGILREMRVELQTRDMQTMILTTVRHDSKEHMLLLEMIINGAQKLMLNAVIKNQSNDHTLGLRTKLKLFWSLTEEINFYANFQLKNDTPIINALVNDFDFSSELMLHFPEFEMMTKTIIYNSAKHKWSNISIEYKWSNMRKEFLKIDTKFDHLLPEDLPNISFYGSIESSQFPNYCAEVIYNLKGNWSFFIKTYAKLAWNNNLNDSVYLIGTYSKENKSITETIHIFEHTIFVKVKPFNINYAVYKQLEVKTQEKESIKLDFKVNGSDKTGDTDLDFSAKFSLLNEGLVNLVNKDCEFLSKFCNGYVNVSLVTTNKEIKLSQQWKRLSEKKNRSLQTILEWPINKFVIIDVNYDEPIRLDDVDDDTALSIDCNPEIVIRTYINERSISMNGNLTLLWNKNQKRIYIQFRDKSVKKHALKAIFNTSITQFRDVMTRDSKLELIVPDFVQIIARESNQNNNKIIKNDFRVLVNVKKHFAINYELGQKYVMHMDDKSDTKILFEYYNYFIDKQNRDNNISTRIEYKTLPEFGAVEQLSALQIKCTFSDGEYLYRDEVWQTDSDHYNSVISFKSTKTDLLATLEQNYKFDIMGADIVKHEIYTYLRITDVIDLISHISLHETRYDNNKIEIEGSKDAMVHKSDFKSIITPKIFTLYTIIDEKLKLNLSRTLKTNHVFDVFIPKTKLSHITNITINSNQTKEIIVQSFTQNTNNPDLYIIDAWISQTKPPHVLIQIPYYFDATLKKTTKNENILPKTVLKFKGSVDSIPYNHVSEYEHNDDSFSFISYTDRIINDYDTLDNQLNLGSAYSQALIQPAIKYETMIVANFIYQPMKKANLEFKTEPYCQQSSFVYNSTSIDLQFSATVYGQQILNISSNKDNIRKFC